MSLAFRAESASLPITVTGQHADEEKIDHMIDTGESETIFQKAILEQGRGYVSGDIEGRGGLRRGVSRPNFMPSMPGSHCRLSLLCPCFT